jgi:hypothetical protein
MSAGELRELLDRMRVPIWLLSWCYHNHFQTQFRTGRC